MTSQASTEAPQRKKVLVSWSSGKDSAWALHQMRQRSDCEIVGMLTTINERRDRVSMHAVRHRLLVAQAEALGLPLWEVRLPEPCDEQQYEAAMARVVERARDAGVQAIAFGDLFLEDVRRYREERLASSGIEPLFPLWQKPTDRLVEEMLSAGVRAIITCIDSRHVPRTLCGRYWDEQLIAELPAGADPCGENGEFHTFVCAGPMFAHGVDVVPGAMVEHGDFVFTDLLLKAWESADSC